MALITINKIPVTEIGRVTALVPFHRTLYIAEIVLEENIVFTPVVALGTQEDFKPLPGAKVIFTLTANGVSSPSFDGFTAGPKSAEYDTTPGAINVVTFEFDGFGFWFNITNDLSKQPLDLVGNFNYGSDEIVITGTEYVTIREFVYHGAPASQVTVFDILTSVHYVGGEELIYSISDNALGPWESNTDPRYAKLTTLLAGTSTVYVKVEDSLLSSPVISCSVYLEAV